ncbi:hypothetical protein ACIRG5_28620 [Lentzea sp. NPDC102401]|uniref:hypothetical protein n=1 Tax=Lentzea sp. NPDC102401 TaxID=3364128 RepID=UPI00381EFFB1
MVDSPGDPEELQGLYERLNLEIVYNATGRTWVKSASRHLPLSTSCWRTTTELNIDDFLAVVHPVGGEDTDGLLEFAERVLGWFRARREDFPGQVCGTGAKGLLPRQTVEAR